MEISVFTTQNPSTADAVKAISDQLARQIAQRNARPDFTALHISAAYQSDVFQHAGAETLGECLHGATSCLGVMSDQGMHSQDGFGAGAFCIWDSQGDYGSAMRALGDDPAAAAAEATQLALQAAGRHSEAPDIVWLSTSPGTEESVLEGVQQVVGMNVPILGGSAADNTIAGDWRVFDATGVEQEGVVVSVLFPSGEVSFAYHSGYAPTDTSGTITKAEGRRLIEIDGEPAASVYNRWTNGTVLPKLPVTEPVSILSESTLSPLGRYLDSVSAVPYFLLAHPSTVSPDGALEMFADVDEGDSLTLMHGSVKGLTERAGKVASLSMQVAGIAPADVKGALMVYCGGCMLAVQDHMSDVINGVVQALPGAPFLGVFTFGEQGMVLDGNNRHGNLMISCIVFS